MTRPTHPCAVCQDWNHCQGHGCNCGARAGHAVGCRNVVSASTGRGVMDHAGEWLWSVQYDDDKWVQGYCATHGAAVTAVNAAIGREMQ